MAEISKKSFAAPEVTIELGKVRAEIVMVKYGPGEHEGTPPSHETWVIGDDPRVPSTYRSLQAFELMHVLLARRA